MKTKILIFLSIVFISAITLTGCKKYEDGPAFSLNTKKARITNQWKLTEETINGAQHTISSEKIDIKKDKSYVITWSGSSETGNWEFSSDKESITFTPNGSSSSDTYKILRLKNNELWLQSTSGSYIFEYHYEKE